MTVTSKTLVPTKYAESTATAEYTAQSLTAIIDAMTATNVSGSSQTFSVWIVPSDGAADNGALIIDGRTLAPNQSYVCPEVVGHVLEDGASVSITASAPSAVTVRLSGREVT